MINKKFEKLTHFLDLVYDDKIFFRSKTRIDKAAISSCRRHGFFCYGECVRELLLILKYY